MTELGYQFHATWGTHTAPVRANILDLVEKTAATWVRIDIGWAMLQPQNRTPRAEDWGVKRIGDTITEAKARGLKVLATLWLTPAWARPAGTTERTAPTDPATYGAALAWAANHWPEVDAWEVWNEPNSADFLVGADPATYTGLVKAARAAAPDALLVAGCTMYVDTDWLTRCLDRGLADSCDVISVHPYMAAADLPPDVDHGNKWSLRHIGRLRELLTTRGLTHPIWATEFGWSAHPNAAAEPNWTKGVTEQQQADYYTAAMGELERLGIPVAFWFTATTSQSGVHMEGYGMLKWPTLEPRPVFAAMKTPIEPPPDPRDLRIAELEAALATAEEAAATATASLDAARAATATALVQRNRARAELRDLKAACAVAVEAMAGVGALL